MQSRDKETGGWGDRETRRQGDKERKVRGESWDGRSPGVVVKDEGLKTAREKSSGDIILDPGAGNVGIGTTSPNAVALLDVSSTTKGFLPPRMTTLQRNAISSPPAGLMIYNTTTNKLNFHNGTAWEVVTSI